MPAFIVDEDTDLTPVSVELWRNDAGEPMGTVVLYQSDEVRVSTSQDMPAQEALEFAAQEAGRRGGDVSVRDPEALWVVGWGELVKGD